MPTDIKYRTTATATGGRTGHTKSVDGIVDLDLSTPKELGGPGGSGTNPEALFAAGYSACFLGAMKAVAAGGDHAKVPNDAAVTGTVGIGPRSEGGFGLDVALEISLPGVDRDAAEKLVQAAHQVCPYSNATRGNLDVRLTVV